MLGSCSICGFEVDKKKHIHSLYTELWYCTDLDECQRRASNRLTWGEMFALVYSVETGLIREEQKHEVV